MFKLEPKWIVGSIWDDCGKSDIVQILVSYEARKINALQFAYVDDQKQVRLSEIHGKPDGSKFNLVTLEYPSEFLTSVSGVYDGSGDFVVIAFGSNKRMYGPFGMTNVGDPPEFKFALLHCNKFNYEFGARSCFAGFHGSVHNSCVSAIGIYLKPITLAELNPIKSLAEPEQVVKLDPSESLAELNIK